MIDLIFIINVILFLSTLFLIFWKKKSEDKDKAISFFVDKYYKIIIVFLFVFVVLTSLIKILDIKLALHADEVGMFHDAKLLAKYGYERHLKRFPVYLINYGDGQSVMYAYITALFVKIFGESIFLIRVPIALFRLISFIFIYKLVKNEEDKLKRIIYLFIFATVPYFIMQAGIGLDCNLLVHFIIIAVSILVNAILKKKNGYLFLSGIFFGLALYTYALSYIILPIVLLFVTIYLLYTKTLYIKQVLIWGVPIIILAIPLILLVLVNQGIIEEINSFITIPKLPNYRVNELSLVNVLNIDKLIFTIMTHDQYAYNSSKYFGTIYYISIPFAIYGFLSEIDKLKESVKNKTFNYHVILLLTFIGSFLPLILVSGINVNKINILFFPTTFFVGTGIIEIFKNRKYLIKYLMASYLVLTVLFIGYYSYKTNDSYKSKSLFVNSDFIETAEYLESRQEKNIYIITYELRFNIFKEYIEMRYGDYDNNMRDKVIKLGLPNEFNSDTLIISTAKKEDNFIGNNTYIGEFCITTYE